MAKLTPRQLAQETALRGETDAAEQQFAANLARGDEGAAASLAEIAAFRGQWPKVLEHAVRFLRKPLSTYAGNVFDDMSNLVALAGFQSGRWQAIHTDVTAIARDLHAAPDPKLQGFGQRLEQLTELARTQGSSAYAWDRGNQSSLDEDARAARFDAGVEKISKDKKKRFKNAAERRKHLFSMASACGSYRSAVRLYKEEGIEDLILFSPVAFTASALARAGQPEAAWSVVEKALQLWWPVDEVQVAPIALLTDAGTRPLMTPERCERVLRTPRGPAAGR